MLRYFKKVDKNPTSNVPGLTEKEVKRANEEVKRVIEQKSGRRAKYNDYTPLQRANIGKYTVEHGPTRASHYFTKVLEKDVPESTVRRLKTEYLQKLKLTDNEKSTSCRFAKAFPGKATIAWSRARQIWMIQSWESVKQRPEIAINGFEKAGILQAINYVV